MRKLKFMLKFAAVAALTAAAFAACAGSAQCPVHDGITSTWTGHSRYSDGTLICAYRCPRGHTFEVACK